MIGAFLGLLLLALTPLNLVAVLIAARRGRYPWWMVTPDDPASPFGQYEPTVRKMYEKVGRYWGDVYWLGLRNSLYGLRYRLKPARFKGVTDYSNFRRHIEARGNLTVYCVEGLRLWQYRRGSFELLAGWMVRGAALDPFTPRQLINMEFRPVFSLRRAG
jgi:hypothetical protein